MASTAQGRRGGSDWVSIGKDLVALLRDAALVVLFLLLLIAPEFIGERLGAAGFEEGTIAGFKWKKQARSFGNEIQNLNQELKDAREVIARQAATIEQNRQVLGQLQASATNPAVKSGLARLEQVNVAAKAASVQAAASLGRTLSRSEPVIEQAQQVIDPVAEWGVVFSADANVDQAQYELARAKKAGLAGARLYFRKGVYRGVAPAENRDQAHGIVERARQMQTQAGRRADAYLVNLASWCPNEERSAAATRCR